MFSALHLHLAINHSPLYTELFAFVLLIFGLAKRNRTFATTGLIVTIIAALCAIAADMSGDRAKDVIAHSPPIAGVEKTAIGPHDDAAGIFLTAACITGGLAIIALWMGRRGERPRWTEVVVVIATFVCILLVARVALLGGRIHHPEVRAVVHAG